MIVIVIPAKGHSTRLPNKNMSVLNGRPMLDYAIDDALVSHKADKVYVSTDDDAIATHCATRGVDVIRRPESLGGDVPIIEVYRHALTKMSDGAKVKVLVGLQPDHPDRDISVDQALERFAQADADVLNSTEIDGTKNGAHYVLSRHLLDGGQPRRQVTVVDHCTNVHFAADLEQAGVRLARRK